MEIWKFPLGIRIVDTGNPCSADGRFIGTVLTNEGSLVWHVFEVGG
jgi:hypothetical protein